MSQLLSGVVEVANSTISSGTTDAGTRLVPLPPTVITPPPVCTPPPPPGTPTGPAAGGFPNAPNTGVHEGTGLWPRYGAGGGGGGDTAMRFATCNTSAVMHP